MIIPRELPRFSRNPALIVVSGRQDASIFLVSDGEINQLKTINIPKPRYSDREGFFESRTGGQLMGSGSVYKENKQYLIKTFLQELKKELNEIDKKNKIKNLFIFCALQFCGPTIKSIPPKLRKKLTKHFSGDLHDAGPLKLLDIINREFFEQKKWCQPKTRR